MVGMLPICLLQCLFLCGGQVMLKLALANSGKFEFTWKYFVSQLDNWWFLGCGISFLLAGGLWLYILKNFPLSLAYTVSHFSYVFGMFAAILIFKETITWVQWIGVILVFLGTVLVTLK
ncbi:MAG: EamA family transporter [Bacteroidales bacterium]|nr:EamA family transporter [Bacteroidales bacterium]